MRQAHPCCVYFAGSMESSILHAHSGTFSVKWRRYDALTPTTSALSEITGTPTHPLRAGAALAVSDVTATVEKYGAHVSFSEEADLLNSEGEMGRKTFGLVSTLGIQAGRSLNRLQRNIIEDNATPIYTSGSSPNSGLLDGLPPGPFGIGEGVRRDPRLRDRFRLHDRLRDLPSDRINRRLRAEPEHGGTLRRPSGNNARRSDLARGEGSWYLDSPRPRRPSIGRANVWTPVP